MSLKDEICKAFCSGIAVRDVPMGLAIATSTPWITGDRLVFYARQRGKLVRFEDSGSTLFDLETSGVDTSSQSRAEIISYLCTEYGVTFDQDDFMFHSDWMKYESAGREALRFMSFLTRIQDLVFTTKERVARTFREDLIAALEREFGDEATITTGSAPVDALPYYTVDIVVRHRNGRTAAIFPGIGDQKALEAILFAKELELKKIESVTPFLVIEEASSKIRQETKIKAMNSQLNMAAWDGGEAAVMEKVRKYVAPIAA